MHFLFGTVLAVDDPALLLMAASPACRCVILALFWRPLVLECVDPGFLRTVSRAGGPVHIAFLALVVLNLVGGFQALGTLLAVGLMMLPAATRFWARDISGMIGGAIGCAAAFRLCRPAALVSRQPALRPAIILVAGVLYTCRSSSGRSAV